MSSLRRKHMDLRRHGSFVRLQRLPYAVDDWFRTNEALHQDIETFAAAHCLDSPSFSVSAPSQQDSAMHPSASLSSSSMHESGSDDQPRTNAIPTEDLDHTAYLLLKSFVTDVIDAHLSVFRQQEKVSESEFEAILQLSLEEESEGRHFFRWTDVTSMPAFLVLMRTAYRTYQDNGASKLSSPPTDRPATKELLRYIECRSIEARNLHRRRTLLRPLLCKWCPASFQAILDLIHASSTEFPPGLDVHRKKNLARWKVTLCTPALSPDGVYLKPPRDEEEWLLYLGRYCEMMTDGMFESFVAYAEAFLSGRSEEGEELKDRRAAWLCFQQLDPLHTGTVYLEDLIDELSRFEGLFSSDAHQKLVFRKLRLKIEAEEKTNQANVRRPGHIPLIAKTLATVEVALPPTSSHDENTPDNRSTSSQSVQAGDDPSKPTSERAGGSSPSTMPHASPMLLDLNQFHKALEYVFRQSKTPTSKTFRLFVTALHKIVAQSDSTIEWENRNVVSSK